MGFSDESPGIGAILEAILRGINRLEGAILVSGKSGASSDQQTSTAAAEEATTVRQEGTWNVNVVNTPTVVAEQSGTWNVSINGEVDVTPASPSANSYLPVRITNGSQFLTPSVDPSPNFAPISISNTGSSTNVLVSAQPNNRIRVLAVCLITNTDLDVQFKSGSSPGTNLTGIMSIPARGGFVSEFKLGLFETETNQPLVLAVSGTAGSYTIGGWLVWTPV